MTDMTRRQALTVATIRRAAASAATIARSHLQMLTPLSDAGD
jgi:hypothetical protein